MAKEQNRKKEDKIKELQEFIARFSANKSKSRQATSRKKLLDKITLDDIKPSSRRYPFVGFDLTREVGNEILNIGNLTLKEGDKVLLDNMSMRVNKGDKIGFIGNEIAITKFFEAIEAKTDYEGQIEWGQTITHTYFPKDNTEYFEHSDLNLIDWMRQFSEEQSEIYLRGFLGKMLFSGDEVLKKQMYFPGRKS